MFNIKIKFFKSIGLCFIMHSILWNLFVLVIYLFEFEWQNIE